MKNPSATYYCGEGLSWYINLNLKNQSWNNWQSATCTNLSDVLLRIWKPE